MPTRAARERRRVGLGLQVLRVHEPVADAERRPRSARGTPESGSRRRRRPGLARHPAGDVAHLVPPHVTQWLRRDAGVGRVLLEAHRRSRRQRDRADVRRAGRARTGASRYTVIESPTTGSRSAASRGLATRSTPSACGLLPFESGLALEVAPKRRCAPRRRSAVDDRHSGALRRESLLVLPEADRDTELDDADDQQKQREAG